MDPLLYGSSEEERIVAVSPSGDRSMRIYVRGSQGINSREAEFYPFFFLSSPAYLKNFQQKHWIKELGGNNYFRHLCAFTNWSGMWDAVQHVIQRYNEGTPLKIEAYGELPVMHLRTDAVSQFLMQTGKTLFKGMEFSELYRLQLDIETYSKQGVKATNPRRPEDRIVVIGLSDNRGWEYAIDGRRKSENEMLEELASLIREKDFDVIEGHNIYGFDLPYILTRCDLLGVDFSIGRDGTTPRSFDSRISFAERAVEYTSCEIAGRHILDTWLLLQAYDVSKRTLESYGLKYAAQHFGFAREGRVYIQPERISWYWDNEPETLIRYCLDDVRETRALGDYLSKPAFCTARMVPMNYGTLARTGSSAKIEAMLLREYIRQKHSVPRPETSVQTTGGYADVFYTGILEHVLDVDFESLYPSIMIMQKISPASEVLGVFTAILQELTRMRIEAKRNMETSADSSGRAANDALQGSLKTLINSFYGYLGYSRGLFNDMVAAEKVTEEGQKNLRHLIAVISARGGNVIEVDTDGIFFVPPTYVKSAELEAEYVGGITGELPQGVNLAISGRYRKMLSYKKKNYALLSYDGKIKIKGSSLNGRNIEKFCKKFIHQAIGGLLLDNIEEVHSLYVKTHKEISDGMLMLQDFIKTETLKESMENYLAAVKSESRNRTASYEVAIASGTDWKPGDRISYYITGTEVNVKSFENCKLAEDWDPNFRDENIKYYLRRLDDAAKKFEMFFTPQDFRTIFSVDDLFGFSAEGVKIQTLPVKGEHADFSEEEAEIIRIDPKIWLDES